jgi:parallel beta-helix repeat protein
MSGKKLWGFLLAVAAAIDLSAQSAAAASVARVVGTLKDPVTGKETCQASITKSKRYATIQAAVDATLAERTTSTIWVCPGRYPEQVFIHNTPDYQPIITLQGSNLTSGPAVIAAPSGPLNAFASTNYGSVAAQVLVTDTTGVTIKNLEVDGTGLACPNTPFTAGVMFANNGNPATSNTEAGTIQFVNVHDQLPTCGLSAGILAENAYIKINDNTIRNVTWSGILEYGGNATMLRNTIGTTSNAIVYTGIRSTAARPIDVSLNLISQVYIGILLEQGTNSVQVDKNTISATVSTGIYMQAAYGNFVRWNNISNAWAGIILDGGPIFAPPNNSNNIVTGNAVSNCGYACIEDSQSGGENRIFSNTLTNSASYGIWLWYVADFDQNGTAPGPPPDPFLDWDSIYSNVNVGIPVAICHAPLDNPTGGCASTD